MKSDVIQKVGIITSIGLGVGLSAALIRCLVNKKTNISGISDRNNPVELKIEVPRKSLGYIIGKKGATISKIREKTDTTIKICDQNEDVAVMTVRGQKRKAEAAIEEISRIITSLPRVATKEVILNENTWPLIVGINGDNVRNLSSESQTELTVKWIKHPDAPDYKPSKYIITIRGSSEQINHALALIDERVAQASVQHSSKTVGVAGRALLYNIAPSMQGSVSQEVLPTDTVDGYVSVFVSAVQSPSHFWVQICGPKSAQLDKLTNEMSDFYKEEIEYDSNTYRLQSVIPSEIVAVCNEGDKDYYRALILSVEKRKDNQLTVNVLFVDFGDSCVCGLNDMFALKPEYLSMPFQAIKCSLYNVIPVDGDRWSMEAITMFEEISHAANWVTLMMKPFNSVNESCSEGNEEVKDIVQVSLIDTNGATDIDISQSLVDAGFAVWRSQ